jgi:DNA-binding MarR family transcriptional regulator
MNKRLGIRIGFLIHDVSRLRRALFDKRSSHLDITRSESWVLTGIARRPEGLSQTDLARVLGLGKVATGEFVALLERKGFVSRHMQPGDRRTNRVQLTPRGQAMLTQISAVVVKMNNEIFKEFSPPELEHLAGGLKGMKLKLAAMLEVTSPEQRRKLNGAGSRRISVATAQRPVTVAREAKRKHVRVSA